MEKSVRFSWLLIVGLAAILITSSAQSAVFTGLSDLPGGSFYSQAWAVSGDGSTVVGLGHTVNSYGTDVQTGFRWTPSTGMTALPMSIGTDVSYNGSVIVGDHYRWTQSGGLQDLGSLGGGTAVYGVSADGTAIVGFSDTGYTSSDTRRAVRWTESGGMQDLGRGRAEDVSADGNVVVGNTGTGQAFRWTPQTGLVGLTNGPLNQPFYGQPNGISADGSTIVGQGPEAWIWRASTGFQFLGFNQAAYAASADGSIVVGGDQWSGTGIAFIWDAANGARNLKDLLQSQYGLNLTGWTLDAALDISNDGNVMVGVGHNPSGQTEAWYVNLAAPVPIPSALWLFISGIGFLVTAIRKTRTSV